MDNKGRKTIRDEPKTETVLLRLTKSEKALMQRFANSRRIKLSEMLIDSVFKNMISCANYQFTIEEIKSLERDLLPKKWKQPSK